MLATMAVIDVTSVVCSNKVHEPFGLNLGQCDPPFAQSVRDPGGVGLAGEECGGAVRPGLGTVSKRRLRCLR
jgi:hypothetical protein